MNKTINNELLTVSDKLLIKNISLIDKVHPAF